MMSKKIESHLNNYTQKIIRYQDAYPSGGLIYPLENQVELIAQEAAEKLRYSNMRDIRKVKEAITEELLTIVKSTLNSNNPELKNKQRILEIQNKILAKTIEIKREYQRKFSHQVERNLIEHGFFGNTFLKKESLQKQVNEDGIIEYTKEGIRRLYYRNDAGNLLTLYDTKVFITLMKLWKDKGEEPVFSFYLKELIKAMESELSGKEYMAVAESLETLSKTSIIMEEYFDPNTQKRTRTRIHHPIQNAEINHKENKATIEFNSYLHNSLKAGYTIQISMALFNDLASPISKNLYLYISNTMDQMLDLDLLIETLGIHSNTRTKAVKLINDAFEELKSYELIKDYALIKEGRFYKEISYVPSDWLSEQKKLLLEEGLSYFTS